MTNTQKRESYYYAPRELGDEDLIGGTAIVTDKWNSELFTGKTVNIAVKRVSTRYKLFISDIFLCGFEYHYGVYTPHKIFNLPAETKKPLPHYIDIDEIFTAKIQQPENFEKIADEYYLYVAVVLNNQKAALYPIETGRQITSGLRI